MEKHGDQIQLTTEEARAGSTPNVVRWVLGIGLLLAIVAMSLAWIIPSLYLGDNPANETDVSARINDARDEAADREGLTTPPHGEETP